MDREPIPAVRRIGHVLACVLGRFVCGALEGWWFLNYFQYTDCGHDLPKNMVCRNCGTSNIDVFLRRIVFSASGLRKKAQDLEEMAIHLLDEFEIPDEDKS